MTPLTPASIRAEVQQILEGVSPEVMRDNLTRLVGFETRHTLSATDDPVRGIGAARQHILETLRGYGGRLQVDFDTYQVKASGRRLSRDFELRNVIATLPGSNPPARQRILLVSGHYDTLAFSRRPEGGFNFDPNTYAPGADDDGSGTAVVMELARLMADYPTEATVMFVTVAGEELGLIGSSLLAQRLAREGANVEAMITNDIVGSPEGGDGQIDGTRVRVFSAGPADSGSRAWARYIRRVAGAYLPSIHIDTIFRYDRFGRGGDHTPFVQEGYRGVRITESHEFYARQHTTEDELEYVDFDYMANVARVNAAALATLANAPAPPRVNDEERGRPMLSRGDSRYDARLRWLPNEEEDLAGYVVWMRRTTSPFWERSWRAGNVTEFILTDVSIDDWTFGIQAVDTDGNESLISAYVYPLRERRVIETVSR
ncbi:MAG: M20/M25/M40 family metallo-hydrolase [Acidobacteria bacterium]|nr:M20/M25/M40 family metallo-hydrolase [Acidobacteriota bacterium]